MTTEAPISFLIDTGVPAGTVSNVASVLDLLAFLDCSEVTEKQSFGIYLVLCECINALRYAEKKLAGHVTNDSEIEITLDDKTAANLARIAKELNCSPNEAARRLAIDWLRHRLNPTDAN